MNNREEIEELKEEIKTLEEEIEDLENGENTEEYDEMLDEQGDVCIGSLTYAPSLVLKETDPTAYRCGLIDYNDSRMTEIKDEIEEIKESIKELEE